MTKYATWLLTAALAVPLLAQAPPPSGTAPAVPAPMKQAPEMTKDMKPSEGTAAQEAKKNPIPKKLRRKKVNHKQ